MAGTIDPCTNDIRENIKGNYKCNKLLPEAILKVIYLFNFVMPTSSQLKKEQKIFSQKIIMCPFYFKYGCRKAKILSIRFSVIHVTKKKNTQVPEKK